MSQSPPPYPNFLTPPVYWGSGPPSPAPPLSPCVVTSPVPAFAFPPHFLPASYPGSPFSSPVAQPLNGPPLFPHSFPPPLHASSSIALASPIARPASPAPPQWMLPSPPPMGLPDSPATPRSSTPPFQYPECGSPECPGCPAGNGRPSSPYSSSSPDSLSSSPQSSPPVSPECVGCRLEAEEGTIKDQVSALKAR